MKNQILDYQQWCFNSYLDSINIDQPYTFPDGNFIRPFANEISFNGLNDESYIIYRKIICGEVL